MNFVYSKHAYFNRIKGVKLGRVFLLGNRQFLASYAFHVKAAIQNVAKSHRPT